MPGRQVTYVEALEHPEFEMKSPLKPATRYFWSVRLRRDKTVTSWSTYGYFHFYVVAWTSGHGQWLSFVTPDQ